MLLLLIAGILLSLAFGAAAIAFMLHHMSVPPRNPEAESGNKIARKSAFTPPRSQANEILRFFTPFSAKNAMN